MAEDTGRRGPTDFHVLYRGITAVIRTRDLRRLLDGLLAYLSAMVEQPDDTTLRLDVLAFVKDGAAVLAPADIRTALPSLERRLNAKGLRVVDRPWARLDPATAELVLTAAELAVDVEVLDEVAAGRDPAVAPGRYPLVGWGFGVGPGESGPISRALAVTLAGARLVDRRTVRPGRALGALARVMGGIQPVALWSDRPEELVEPLTALTAGDGRALG